MIRSSVDRPGVKPLCCGRCFVNIVFFIRARHMWAKTLAGTVRSDMPRYLVPSYILSQCYASNRHINIKLTTIYFFPRTDFILCQHRH